MLPEAQRLLLKSTKYQLFNFRFFYFIKFTIA